MKRNGKQHGEQGGTSRRAINALGSAMRRCARPAISGFLALSMLIGSVPAPAYAEMLDEATHAVALAMKEQEECTEAAEDAEEPSPAEQQPQAGATEVPEEQDEPVQQGPFEPSPESSEPSVPPVQDTPAALDSEVAQSAPDAPVDEDVPTALFSTNNDLTAASVSADALSSRAAAVDALKHAGASNDVAEEAANAVLDAGGPGTPGEDEGIIRSISTSWVTKGDDVSPEDPNQLIFRPEGNTSHAMRMRMSYSISAKTNHAPGSITFTIPEFIFYNREGKPTGSLQLAIPEDPITTAGWNYKRVAVDGKRMILITNTRRLKATTQGFMEFSIAGVFPRTQIDLKPSSPFNVVAECVTADNKVDSKKSNDLSVVFDTYSALSSVTKRISGTPFFVAADDITVSIAHKAFPDATGFIVVSWYMDAYIRGNQPSLVSFTDELADGYRGVILSEAATDGGRKLSERLPDNGVGSTGYRRVEVAYPVEQFEHGKSYTFKNKVSYDVQELDPAADGTEKPVQTKSVVASNAWTYYAPQFIEPGGHYNLYNYGNDNVAYYPESTENRTHEPSGAYETSDTPYGASGYNGYYGLYAKGLNMLSTGEDVDVSYTFNPVGYMLPWTYQEPEGPVEGNPLGVLDNYGKRPVTMAVEQQDLQAAGKTLTAGADFEYTSITFPKKPVIKKAVAINLKEDGSIDFSKHDDGTVEYVDDHEDANIPDLELQVKTGADNTWQPYATVSWKTGSLVITLASGEVLRDSVMPLPAGITAWKMTSTSTVAAFMYYGRVGIKLKASGAMGNIALKSFDRSNAPRVIVESNANLVVRRDSGNMIYSLRKAAPDRLLGYTDDMRALMKSGVSRFSQADVDTANSRIKVSFNAQVTKKSLIADRKVYEEALESGDLLAERSGTWYDLLPIGMTPIVYSVRLRSGDQVQSVNTIENFRGTGRTLLIVQAKLKPRAISYTGSVGGMDQDFYQDVLDLQFDAWYGFDDITYYGNTFHNIAMYHSDNEEVGNVKGYRGEPDDPRSNNNLGTEDAFKGEKAAVLDALTNIDGVEPERNNALYAGSKGSVDPLQYGNTGLMKEVSVNGEDSWGVGAHMDKERLVYNGGVYTYRLSMTTTDSMLLKDIVLYDSLENHEVSPDDGGPISDAKRWRGTFSSIDVSQLEYRGCSPVVYYSTAESAPGKGLILSTGTDDDLVENSKNTNLEDSAIWTRSTAAEINALPRAERAKITAIAVDASKKADGKDFELRGLQAIAVLIHMEAPRGDVAAEHIKNKAQAFNAVHMASSSKAPLDKNWGERAFTRQGYTAVGLKPCDIAVEKKWDDDNNRDGMRPKSVTVQLVANGKDVPGKQVVLTEQSGWAPAVFEGLPYLDEDGNKFMYTVRESPTPEGYEPTIDRRGDTFVLTNRHDPILTEARGKKIWEGDTEEVRPAQITVKLKANGKLLERRTVRPNAMGEWEFAFRNLYKYEEGSEISYEIEEEMVNSYGEYIPSVEGFNIRNLYHPYGDLAISKTTTGDVTDASKGKEFTFRFTLKNGDEPIFDNFKYEITGAGVEEGKPIHGTVETGGTFTLRSGQTVRIKELPSQARYEIEEINIPDGYSVNGDRVQRGIVYANQTGSLSFHNVYSAGCDVDLTAKKQLNGYKLTPRRFSFQLLDQNGNVVRTAKNGRGKELPHDAQGNIVSEGDVSFGALHFDQFDSGKYFYYVIEEVQEDGNGITCDTDKYVAVVYPTDNGDGTMSYVMQYATESLSPLEPGEVPVFKNAYRTSGEVPLKVHKELKGGELAENQFTFNLDEVVVRDGVPQLEEVQHGVTNAADGSVVFNALSFNQSDAGEEHLYAIHEVPGDDASLTYDGHYALIKVVVADDGMGTLSFGTIFDGVTSSCFVCGADGKLDDGSPCTACKDGLITSTSNSLVFVNRYKPTGLDIQKTLENAQDAKDPNHLFEFELELSNEKGEPIEKLDFAGASLERIDVASTETNREQSKIETKVVTPDAIQGGEAPHVQQAASASFAGLFDYLFKPQVAGAAEMKAIQSGGNEQLNWTYDQTTKELVVGGSKINKDNMKRYVDAQIRKDALTVRFDKGARAGELEWLFEGFSSVTRIDMSNLDTSTTTTMDSLFKFLFDLESVNLAGLNTSNVTDMSCMFEMCRKLSSIDVSSLDTSRVTNMSAIFEGCEALTKLDLSGFNTSNVTSMFQMFYGCARLTDIDVSSFDTSRVVNMGSMFASTPIQTIDVSNFDTTNVTNMGSLFSDCEALQRIDLSSWDTSKVTNMSYMFKGAKQLTYVDISSFDVSSCKANGQTWMFMLADSLDTLMLGPKFRFVATDSSFSGPQLTNGKLNSGWVQVDENGDRLPGAKTYKNRELVKQYPKCGVGTYMLDTFGKVYFDANGGVGSSEVINIKWDKDVVLKAPEVVLYGHVLTGWKIKKSYEQEGQGTVYEEAPDGTITIPVEEAQDFFRWHQNEVFPLKAQWKPDYKVDEVKKGVYRFKIPAGYVLHLPDVIPAGTSYAVREVDEPGYKLVESSGTAGIVTAGSAEAPKAAFVNAELAPDEPQRARAEVRVSKLLDGALASAADGFNFEMVGFDPVTDKQGTWMAAVSDGGSVRFPALVFDETDLEGQESRDFEYRIVELDGGNSAIEYDTDPIVATVTLAKRADGGLSTDIAFIVNGNKTERPAFKNVSKPGSLSISKVVEGADAPSTPFAFRVMLDGKPFEGAYSVDGKQLQATDGLVKVRGGSTAQVGAIPVGTPYSVEEVELPDGWSLKDVAGPTAGTIAAGAETSVTFTNAYAITSGAYAQIVAYKSFEGGGLVDGMFTFDLYEGRVVDAARLVGSAVNGPVDIADQVVGPDGSLVDNPHKGMAPVYFPELTYSAPGVYEYTLAERVLEDVAGVTFDTELRHVTVTVSDNGDGTLSASVAYADASGSPLKEGPVFVNTPQSVGLVLKKVVTTDLPAGSPARDAEFGFKIALKDSAGEPLRNQVYAITAPDGKTERSHEVSDGGTIKLRNGESAVFKGLPYGASYAIEEQALPGWAMDPLACSGELAGTLTNVAEPASVVIANAYQASGTVHLVGEKRFDGELKDNQFAFDLIEIRAGGVRELVATTRNKADGSIDFGKIGFALDDVGKRFTYEATERDEGESGIAYDHTVYSIEVAPRDNGDGTIACDYTIMCNGERVDAIVFTNSRTVELPFTGGSGVGAMGVLVIAIGCMAYLFDRKRRTRSI